MYFVTLFLLSVLLLSLLLVKKNIDNNNNRRKVLYVHDTSKLNNLPKLEGQQCSYNEECDGYNYGLPGSLACCNGVCKKQLKDWSGVGYCPEMCRDGPNSKKETCGTGYSWPRLAGEPCDNDIMCSTGLCNNNNVCSVDCPDGTIPFRNYCVYDRDYTNVDPKGCIDGYEQETKYNLENGIITSLCYKKPLDGFQCKGNLCVMERL